MLIDLTQQPGKEVFAERPPEGRLIAARTLPVQKHCVFMEILRSWNVSGG